MEKSDFVEDWYINESYCYSKNVENKANGVLAVPKDRDKVLKYSNQINDEIPEVHSYLSHNWLNILNKEISKSSAIMYLIEINNWKKENCITLGDELNDLEMNKDFYSYTFEYANLELIKNSNKIVKNFSDAIEEIKRTNT